MGKRPDSCYLDANCLIYFLQESSPLHIQAKEIIKKLRSSSISLVISPLCLDEFLYNFPGNSKTKARALSKILKLPTLKITNPPVTIESQLKIPRLMSKYKLKPRDAYHLLIARENKVKYFATFDSDFNSVFSSKILSEFLI